MISETLRNPAALFDVKGKVAITDPSGKFRIETGSSE